MIGYVKGVITHLFGDSCYVDVRGVGYRVYVAASTRDALSEGEEVTLYTYMSVREDAIQLYGFASMAEYDLFLLLISVSGIGPKVGLGMLSGMPAESIMLAIYNGDVKALTKLPGIGKKSAERLVLELKDKINKLGSVSASDEVTPTAAAQRATGVAGETLAALLSLGYTEQEVAPEIERLDDGTKDVSQLLRAVLSSLGKGR